MEVKLVLDFINKHIKIEKNKNLTKFLFNYLRENVGDYAFEVECYLQSNQISLEIESHMNVIEIANKIKSSYEQIATLQNNMNFDEIRLFDTLTFPVEYDLVRTVYPKPGASLKGIHKNLKCKTLNFYASSCNNIQEGGLGILLIKNLEEILPPYSTNVTDIDWIKIIIKHFKGDKDVLECQEELIENGYKQFAKL